MKAIRALFLLIVPVAVAAHPGGGLIALDVNTVIFGDSMYNSVWRLEKGKKAQALVTKFHAHWTTRGLDDQIYSESFQEMGGALFASTSAEASQSRLPPSRMSRRAIHLCSRSSFPTIAPKPVTCPTTGPTSPMRRPAITVPGYFKPVDKCQFRLRVRGHARCASQPFL